MRAETHVYRINRPRLLVLPAIWLLVVGVLLWAVGVSTTPAESEAGVGAALIVTLIIGIVFYFAVWRSRLELDPHGITHFQFGYTIRSSWSNLERISMQPGAEGLYLAKPGTDSRLLRGSIWIVKGLSAVTGIGSIEGDAEALAEGRFIALIAFTSHLGGGPLSKDLERWAPQLFLADAKRTP